MTPGRPGLRLVRATAALLVVASGLVAVAGGAPAGAIDQSKGYAGFCRTATGVTVVIDFQELGGTTYVRCFPQGTPGTGLDALKGAGFQIEGVRRWGESFICRIENRPAAVESIAVEGDPDYQEQCLDTPPAAAYWSYWHAGNNCRWNYSQWGVKNRRFVQGGFEGWSFSLNATADSNPVPRIAPVRPGTEGGACTTEVEAPPSTDDPDEQQQPQQRPGSVLGGTGGSGDGSSGTNGSGSGEPAGTGDGTADPGGDETSSADDPDLPLPKPRTPTGDRTDAAVGREQVDQDPADNVAFSGGAEARDVRDVVREQQGGQWWAPWLAAVAVAALGGAMFWTSRRRRLARDA